MESPQQKFETHGAFVGFCDQQDVEMTHCVLSPSLCVPIYRLQGFSSPDLCRKITQLVREYLWSVFHIHIKKKKYKSQKTYHTHKMVYFSISEAN